MMKCSISLVAVFAVILCVFIEGRSQAKLEPMPETATLAEGQEWLVLALEKNFGYGTIDDNVKISDVKFDGCKMSYRVLQRYTDQKSALGEMPGLGKTGAVRANEVSYSVYEDVSFSLKNINSRAVGLAPLSTPKGMQAISLETVGKNDFISFDRKGSSTKYNTSGLRSTTLFPIKETAGEAIANGFIRLIQLCQAPKPKP